MYVIHDISSLVFLFAVVRPHYNYTREDFHYHPTKAYWDPQTIRSFYLTEASTLLFTLAFIFLAPIDHGIQYRF